MPDIADQLDAAIGAAPPDAPALAPTLVLGRRALRRRRLAYGVGTVATALVIGGTAWAVAPGDDSTGVRDDSSVADQSDGQSDEMADEKADEKPAAPEPWGADELVRVSEDGTYQTNPRAETMQTSDLMAGDASAHIWVLRLGGKHYYALVERDGTIHSQPATGSQGLDVGEWAMAILDPDSRSIPADDAFVRFDAGSHVVGVEGVDVVRQQPDPGLGESFAGPGDPTALAEVTYEGVTWFLAVRAIDGDPAEAIPYRKDRKIQTFQEFIDYAQQQYATNDEGGSEGMR